jgi:hypothetical protein
MVERDRNPVNPEKSCNSCLKSKTINYERRERRERDRNPARRMEWWNSGKLE